MIDKRIKLLRSKFFQHKIDGYVVPKNDQFFSEYAAEDRLKIISNFSGSAGLAIVLKKKISKSLFNTKFFRCALAYAEYPKTN